MRSSGEAYLSGISIKRICYAGRLCELIYTELLVPGPDVAALDALPNVYDTLRSPLPWPCAALAARAFATYRLRGGARRSPLPDFYIGTHAAVANLAVLTRDERPYRAYFPRLKRVCPA